MTLEKNKITLIAGKSMTDFYLINSLSKEIGNIKVIEYKGVKIKNLKYYVKKISKIGLINSFNIKMLSIFLRLEIQIEKALQKTIWEKLSLAKPALIRNSKTLKADNINDLLSMVEDDELIIVTQSIRLPDRFFKKNRLVLEVVGGKFPNYCGDIAIFGRKH